MNVVVNGEQRAMGDVVSVADVVAGTVSGDRHGGIAVALNGEVVLRSDWQSTVLNEGDRIEILHAIGGG